MPCHSGAARFTVVQYTVIHIHFAPKRVGSVSATSISALIEPVTLSCQRLAMRGNNIARDHA